MFFGAFAWFCFREVVDLGHWKFPGAGMQLPTRLTGPVFGVGGCQRVMPKIGQVTGHFLLIIVKTH